MVKPCWTYGTRRGGGVGKRDGLMWYKDLGSHGYGEYSMAVIQANQFLEDQSQLVSGALSLIDESSLYGTFVGVYDGHGGPETSRFVNDNLFNNMKSTFSFTRLTLFWCYAFEYVLYGSHIAFFVRRRICYGGARNVRKCDQKRVLSDGE